MWEGTSNFPPRRTHWSLEVLDRPSSCEIVNGGPSNAGCRDQMESQVPGTQCPFPRPVVDGIFDCRVIRTFPQHTATCKPQGWGELLVGF